MKNYRGGVHIKACLNKIDSWAGINYSPEDADVLIITLRTGFPYGMAATSRILLMARALHKGGAMPAVVHMNTSENKESHRNTISEGVHQGIPFRYACGKVQRPDSFLSRRLCTISGFLRTCMLITKSTTTGRLRTVIFYERSIFSLLPIMLLCKLMKVTFALDLVEWPVAMERGKNLLGRTSLRLYRTVALRLADRVTAISRFLCNRAREIRRRPDTVMYLPILGDSEETPVQRRPVHGRFVISISTGYYRELTLVLEAFTKVRDCQPEAELHITGGLCEDDLYRVLDRSHRIFGDGVSAAAVKCRGYLSRRELLELFSTSCAAIVALEDDLRSLSRMPTKIADYTFNGIPLVTGGIGDVTQIFSEGESAFMYLPGDSTSLADALLRVFDDREKTERIGTEGKELALALFSFERYSGKLVGFLTNLKTASIC